MDLRDRLREGRAIPLWAESRVGMQGLRMGCEGAGDKRQSGVPVNMYFKEEEN